MDANESAPISARNLKQLCHRIFISSLDVDKAFDQREAHSMERVLLEHRAHAYAIAVVLREMVDPKVWPTVAG